MRLDNLRDDVAGALANFILRHIATPWYRGMIGGLIRAGIEATEKGGK